MTSELDDGARWTVTERTPTHVHIQFVSAAGVITRYRVRRGVIPGLNDGVQQAHPREPLCVDNQLPGLGVGDE